MGEQLVTIGDKEFTLWIEEGVVKAVQNVGGSIYSQQHSVLAGGSYLTHEDTSDTQFYFIDKAGRETLAGLHKQFPLLVGHEVKVLYCAPKGEKIGAPVAVFNETLRQRTDIDPKAFNDRYKAISTAWLNARLGFGCLTTIALLAATFVLPVYLKKDSYFQTFGIAFLIVFAYMMYEGGLGIRIWSWRRMRALAKTLSRVTSQALPCTT